MHRTYTIGNEYKMFGEKQNIHLFNNIRIGDNNMQVNVREPFIKLFDTNTTALLLRRYILYIILYINVGIVYIW